MCNGVHPYYRKVFTPQNYHNNYYYSYSVSLTYPAFTLMISLQDGFQEKRSSTVSICPFLLARTRAFQSSYIQHVCVFVCAHECSMLHALCEWSLLKINACVCCVHERTELNDTHGSPPIWIGSSTEKKLYHLSMTTLASLQQGSTSSLK